MHLRLNRFRVNATNEDIKTVLISVAELDKTATFFMLHAPMEREYSILALIVENIYLLPLYDYFFVLCGLFMSIAILIAI
jgi:hypothetical protein